MNQSQSQTRSLFLLLAFVCTTTLACVHSGQQGASAAPGLGQLFERLVGMSRDALAGRGVVDQGIPVTPERVPALLVRPHCDLAPGELNYVGLVFGIDRAYGPPRAAADQAVAARFFFSPQSGVRLVSASVHPYFVAAEQARWASALLDALEETRRQALQGDLSRFVLDPGARQQLWLNMEPPTPQRRERVRRVLLDNSSPAYWSLGELFLVAFDRNGGLLHLRFTTKVIDWTATNPSSQVLSTTPLLDIRCPTREPQGR